MDFEENQKRQTIRVIITETLMVLAVLALVGVLVMVVSGYWVNQDLTIGRQGLLQVSSTPTNAAIIVDGETSLFQRTNNSKMVSAGSHTVVISKDGYDTWEKDVNIKEGLLYRLHYPRLFLLERETEKVLRLENVTATTVSPNRDALLVMNNTTDWSMLSLNDNKVKTTTVDVSKVFRYVAVADRTTSGLVSDKIIDYTWSKDGSKILFEVLDDSNETAWIMMDVKNPEKSTDVSKTFGLDISAARMIDDSGDNLMVIEDGNLRRVNISSQSISRILAKNVISYDFLENEIVYVSKVVDGVVIGNLKNADSEAIEFLHYDNDQIWVALSLFYKDKFLTVRSGDEIMVYEWKTPNSMRENEKLEEILRQKISFLPQETYCGHSGEFIIFNSGNKIATLDMESLDILEYEIEAEKFGWIDDDMIFVINNNKLIVYDYDGFNRRELASNVSDYYSVTTSENEKWLYYFSDNYLMRENLLPN